MLARERKPPFPPELDFHSGKHVAAATLYICNRVSSTSKNIISFLSRSLGEIFYGNVKMLHTNGQYSLNLLSHAFYFLMKSFQI